MLLSLFASLVIMVIAVLLKCTFLVYVSFSFFILSGIVVIIAIFKDLREAQKTYKKNRKP